MRQTNLIYHRFAEPKSAALALARAIAERLHQGLNNRDKVVLALSGGKTPTRFFHAMSDQALDWNRVIVTLVDERYVDETSERSNARLVKRHLLQGAAKAAHLVPLYRADCAAEDVAKAPGAELQEILRRGFDAVVLGLGLDGHTASFFPGGNRLPQALDLKSPPAIFAIQAAGAEEPRLTFSASALLRTNGLFLQLEGKEKTAVFEQACQAGPIEDLPVRVFLRQEIRPMIVYRC